MPVTTKQLFRQIQTTGNRIKLAEILVELADRAENNPSLQQILKKMLLPPPFNTMEYIKPRNRKGYWARKPYWREHPTANQLEARLRFSMINYHLYGTKGTVKRQDGTRIGLANQLAGDLMRRSKIVSAEELAEKRKRKVIERIASDVSYFLDSNAP